VTVRLPRIAKMPKGMYADAPKYIQGDWLKAGCPAISAFKMTGDRFRKASHDIASDLDHPRYRHIGPGYYAVGSDINRPTISDQRSFVNPMKDPSPRFSYTPYAMVTEAARPGMEHVGPGSYSGSDPNNSFISRDSWAKQNPFAPSNAKVSFGASVTVPRIKGKSNHDIMMDQVWTRYDHLAEDRKAWTQRTPYVSAVGLQRSVTEAERNELHKLGKKKDAIQLARLKNIRKTGSPDNVAVKAVGRGHLTGGAVAPQKFGASGLLGGEHATPFSIVPRFGKTPYDVKTELQFDSMSHVGPGSYPKSTMHESIRARTHALTAKSNPMNKTAAFSATSPRFERVRVVDISDGGVARRREKAECMEREAQIKLFYGEKDTVGAEIRPTGAHTVR